jgi:4-alpha-glucanotransferase
MSFERSSGVLMHITSLPGEYGIGEIGPEAHRFARWLAEAGQSWWQILPTGPTGYGDSPYQSFSTFAGNTLLLSFEALIEEGLLKREWLADFPAFDPSAVDFGHVIWARNPVLNRVATAFDELASAELKEAFAAFCETESAWLDDYATFMALKEHFDGQPWYEWPAGLRRHERWAIKMVSSKIEAIVERHKILQFLFFRQWTALRAVCAECGVKLLGDIPIFVAPDSADVWANPDLFMLDRKLRPTVVAGVPPDYFSKTGQLWGNPLYKWSAHKKTDYAWWTARVKKVLSVCDAVRIDHFRGFAQHWEIPASEKTAINGAWVDGPGADLFNTLEGKLGKGLPLVAENLGVITEEVEALREQFGMPGMIILQFRFGPEDLNNFEYRPEGTDSHNVVYTGTHDNDTTAGWLARPSGNDETPEADAEFREMVLNYLESNRQDPVGDLIHLAMSSPAVLCITPMQDLIRLGSEGRMNAPGVAHGNWQWRCSPAHLNPGTSEWLLKTTRLYCR